MANKTGKNVKFISRDLFGFSLDPIRRAFCNQNQKNLDISLKDSVSIELNDEYIENNVIKGKVIVSANDEILAAMMQAFNKENNISLLQGQTISPNVIFSDINFSFKKHYEELKEIQNIDASNLGNLFKFKLDFNYKTFIKKYEDFLKANPNLEEVNLPQFDQLVINSVYPEEFVTQQINNDLFEKPENLITLNNIRTELKKVIYDSYIPEDPAGRFFREIELFYNLYNSKKDLFPYHANLVFDSYEKENVNFSNFFNDIGDGKSIFKTVLTFISDSNNINKKRLVFKEDNALNANGIEVDEIILNNNFKNYVENVHGYLTNFFDKLNTVSLTKNKTFENILKGTNSYSEVIGYKISKYDATRPNISLLKQEFYIPNVFTNQVNWVDTQIKFDKRYKYKLSPITLTLTSDYKYTNLTYVNSTVEIDYEIKPNIKIYILDSVEYSNIMTAYTYPPTAPEVDYIPYVGVDNKIKININSTIKVDNFKPISILPTDTQRINDIVDAQREENFNPNEAGKIKFSSDLPIKSFQIFRTSDKPINYSDFSSNLVKTLETNELSAYSFEDNIIPNKKYYYTIRSVDYHDNFSNPTEIFEIELINDAGSIYPLINPIEIGKLNNYKDISKIFRRFLRLQPSLGQRLANKVDNNNVQLGINKDSVWNKEFKIRINSKQTGKKIDFNIKFIYDVTTGKVTIKP